MTKREKTRQLGFLELLGSRQFPGWTALPRATQDELRHLLRRLLTEHAGARGAAGLGAEDGDE